MKHKLSKEYKNAKRINLMTEEEMIEVDAMITEIHENRSEMEEKKTEWADIEEAYLGNQPILDNHPNSRVNVLNANIEGQVSALVEQNISIATRGEGPSDEQFADWARIGIDWTLRKNYIKRIVEQHERRRLKFGGAYMKVFWDGDAINGYGLTRITTPSIYNVYVDRKIKDHLRFQEADYIAEPITMSKTQMIALYGEEKVAAIDFGNNEIMDTTVFYDHGTEDEDLCTLVMWWERHEGKLRLREFTGDGVQLYDSHKKGDRKTNQIDSEYDHKSYYKYTNDKYPYFYTPEYPQEGSLHGIGDGKLILPLQKVINDLYDKIRIAARPHLILFDPDSEVDLEDFDENSYEPRPARLTEKRVVDTVAWGTINESWWRLLNMVHQEIQRVTRFSALMMGGSGGADTATEANIQQQQGNAATEHKKVMFQSTLNEMCEYILGIMMEKYTEGKAFRIAEDKNDYMWIDFRQLAKVPAMKPATAEYKKNFTKNNPDVPIPQWQLLENNGEPMTKSVDLDIEINVGQGLPKNKTFLWQMVEKLAGIQILDKAGQPKQLIHYEELREFVNNFLGIPLKDNEVDEIFNQEAPKENPIQGNPNEGRFRKGVESANAEGQTANNNPSLRNLPSNDIGGGGLG